MIALVATVAGVAALIAATLRADRRRNERTAARIGTLRAALAQPSVYKVIADAAAVPVTPSRTTYLGSLSTAAKGLPCFIEDSRTIVAMRYDNGAQYVFSTTADAAYETITYPLGWWAPTFIHRLAIPADTSPEAVLERHREQIANVGDALVRIQSIEQVAELQTALSRRFVAARASRDPEELLDDDLRVWLGHNYDWRAPDIKRALGGSLPRARVVP